MNTTLQSYLFPSYNRDNFKKLWQHNQKLDRYFVALQSLTIVAFSYREKIWIFFVLISSVSFFIVIFIFFSKIIEGTQLDSMLHNLSKQDLIPAWIPARRRLIHIIYLAINNPIIWLPLSIILADINTSFPLLFIIVLSLPSWLFLELANKKEYKYLKDYL